MQITFGLLPPPPSGPDASSPKKPLIWASQHTINHHLLMVGTSGSGKGPASAIEALRQQKELERAQQERKELALDLAEAATNPLQTGPRRL